MLARLVFGIILLLLTTNVTRGPPKKKEQKYKRNNKQTKVPLRMVFLPGKDGPINEGFCRGVSRRTKDIKERKEGNT